MKNNQSTEEVKVKSFSFTDGKNNATSETNNIPLLDKIINYGGYNRHHFSTFLIMCFVIFLVGIHINLMNCIFIPFQAYYELSEFQVSLISSSMFIAIGSGSLIATSKSITSDRKTVIVLFTFLIFVFNVFMGLVHFLFVFITMRMLIGVAIGILMPLSNNILCEYLPMKNRSFFMIITGACNNIGAIFLNTMMLYKMPNLEKDKLHHILLIMSLPALVFSILMFMLIEESPRYLLVNNKTDEGFTLLTKVTGCKIEERHKQTIIHELGRVNNKNIGNDFCSIFEGKFFWITTSLIFLWIFNSYLSYGGAITLSLTIKYLELTAHNEMMHKRRMAGLEILMMDNSKIIKHQILVYIISLPGCFLAGIMTETKMFGRKMTIFTGFFLVTIFSLVSILDINHFSVHYGLATFFIALCFSAANSYSSEVYPTKIRDKVVGFLYFCTRMSGFLSQFIAVSLFKWYYLSPYYTSIILGSLGCVIATLLPYDTYGKPLDTTEEDEDELHNKVQNSCAGVYKVLDTKSA